VRPSLHNIEVSEKPSRKQSRADLTNTPTNPVHHLTKIDFLRQEEPILKSPGTNGLIEAERGSWSDLGTIQLARTEPDVFGSAFVLTLEVVERLKLSEYVLRPRWLDHNGGSTHRENRQRLRDLRDWFRFVRSATHQQED
jgi:hypothetical protein